MTLLDRDEMDQIAERHAAILHRSFWLRYRPAITGGAIIVYLIMCAWLFSFAKVVGGADWNIAGAYLADWISWEARPEIRIGRDGFLTIDYGKGSPLGDNPHPEWLKADMQIVTRTTTAPTAVATQPSAQRKSSSISFMAPAPAKTGDDPASDQSIDQTQSVTEEATRRILVDMSASATIDMQADRIVVARGTDSFVVPLQPGDVVTAASLLPGWASQARPGEKIVASFGFAGWAEIDNRRVRIHKRFFGWENFLFDTNSAFFDKTAGEVVDLIISGQELKPGTSNFSLAMNDILYNPSWQHLDVWTKLLQTIVMAFVGTVLAMFVSFPLSFLAARNITNNMAVNQIVKRFFDFQRSVDMLIWALFFTRAFGPGPLSGMSAIFFTDTGTLGKLYAEALENIDNKQPEGVKSVGADPVAVTRFGILPQVMPVFLSQALYFWESNTRSATIIGAVGAGGIGLKLWEAMRTNSDWENVAYMVILILVVVFIFDNLSTAIRTRLIGKSMNGEVG